MSIPLLFEAALRSVLMGATIYAVLRLCRITQVRAQRITWLLALFGALAMPALVGFHVGPRLLPESMSVKPDAHAVPSITPAALYLPRVGHAHAISMPRGQFIQTLPIATREPLRQSTPALHLYNYAAWAYLAVAALLLLRLAIGVGLAMRLRAGALRIDSPLLPLADIRISQHIQTPVTVASTILLPETCAEWNEATMRIVLTHEHAHVRQADFYVQLLAGLHSALFWFSPFSWWLQRQLSALGEALSDLAAVEQAESRASYAEVLLGFATTSRSPLAAVAMARTSNLRQRIDRLLSDRLFRQSSAGRRGSSIVAGCVVMLALIAATSTAKMRVHAAQTAPAPPSAGPAPSPQAVPPQPPAPPETPGASRGEGVPAGDTVSGGVGTSVGYGASTDTTTITNTDQTTNTDDVRDGNFSHAYSHNGDVFAYSSGGKDPMIFSGNWEDMKAYDSIRGTLHGPYIFYKHDGKAYVIQDPAILARAKALYAPIDELGRRQEELGKQQEALAKQQEALGRQQEAVKVQTPDLSEQLASLEEALQKLKALQAEKTVDEDTLSNLQERMSDIQARLGELQGEAGERQGKLGEEQGKLGEMQGKLGEEQGRLGEQQGKLAEETQRQLKPLIEQSIRDGRAKPVE
jgi:beta-lactamase regulating signal transducer with metallopeptidase domain